MIDTRTIEEGNNIVLDAGKLRIKIKRNKFVETLKKYLTKCEVVIHG